MRFVIVGGGIAGVSCASELSRIIDSDGTSEENQVTILSASNSLKGVCFFCFVFLFLDFSYDFDFFSFFAIIQTRI